MRDQDQMTSDTGYPTARLLREVMQLEQALAAASDGIGDHVPAGASATAVQVETEARPTESLVQAPRDVARLEDVLTIAPSRTEDSIAPPAPPVVVPEVRPAEADNAGAQALERAKREVARLEELLSLVSVDDQARISASAAAIVVPEVRPAEAGDGGAQALERAKREIARLEQLLTDAIQKETPAVPIELTTSVEQIASVPSYIDATTLREAFWFEQVSAFKSTIEAVAPQVERIVEPARVESVAPPCAQPIDCSEPAQTGRSRWVATLCLLAVAGLVLLLTGRKPRR